MTFGACTALERKIEAMNGLQELPSRLTPPISVDEMDWAAFQKATGCTQRIITYCKMHFRLMHAQSMRQHIYMILNLQFLVRTFTFNLRITCTSARRNVHAPFLADLERKLESVVVYIHACRRCLIRRRPISPRMCWSINQSVIHSQSSVYWKKHVHLAGKVQNLSTA